MKKEQLIRYIPKWPPSGDWSYVSLMKKMSIKKLKVNLRFIQDNNENAGPPFLPWPLLTGKKGDLVLRTRRWIENQRLARLQREITRNQLGDSFEADIDSCIDLYKSDWGGERGGSRTLLETVLRAGNHKAMGVLSNSLRKFRAALQEAKLEWDDFSPISLLTFRACGVEKFTNNIYLRMCLDWEGNIDPSQSLVFRTLLKHVRLWSQLYWYKGKYVSCYESVDQLVRIYTTLVPNALNAAYSGPIPFSWEEAKQDKWNKHILWTWSWKDTRIILCAPTLLQVAIQTYHGSLMKFLLTRVPVWKAPKRLPTIIDLSDIGDGFFYNATGTHVGIFRNTDGKFLIGRVTTQGTSKYVRLQESDSRGRRRRTRYTVIDDWRINYWVKDMVDDVLEEHEPMSTFEWLVFAYLAGNSGIRPQLWGVITDLIERNVELPVLTMRQIRRKMRRWCNPVDYYQSQYKGYRSPVLDKIYGSDQRPRIKEEDFQGLMSKIEVERLSRYLHLFVKDTVVRRVSSF